MQIIVDMDGVIADLPSSVLKMRQKLRPWKKPLTIEDLHDYNLDISLEEPGIMQLIFSMPYFFRNLEPMPGAQEFISQLDKDGHEIVIATILPSARGNILFDKLEWLEEHIFPETTLSRKNVVFCYDKKWLNGDIMIDDRPKNLLNFRGKQILIDWPYNKLTYNDCCSNIIRVKKENIWKDINTIIENTKKEIKELDDEMRYRRIKSL